MSKVACFATLVAFSTLTGCTPLQQVQKGWDDLFAGNKEAGSKKQSDFVNRLPEMSLMELCLAHDKEMRWGYLSRRDYVFVEISKELKQRGEDPLLCRKTSEHNH